MTWRRFMVLIKGLSPNSATVALMQSRAQWRTDDPFSTEDAIQSPEGASLAFQVLFAPKAGTFPEPPIVE